MTTTPTTPTTRPAMPGHRPWTGGRTALVVAGGVIALVGASTLVGGGLALWADQQLDSDGYLTVGPEVFATDSHALSVPSLDVSVIGPDYFNERDMLGDVRIQAAPTDADTSLFIGIGPADDVAAYLEQVSHDEISDIDLNPFDVTYTPHRGGEPAGDPAAETFWAASDSGTGPRTITWHVSAGDWAVVIMNADGSTGVHTELTAGATLPIVRTVAIIALIGGGILLICGIAMIIAPIASRGPGDRDSASTHSEPEPCALSSAPW